MYNTGMNLDIIHQTLQEIHGIQGPSRILCVDRESWYDNLIDIGGCVVYVPSTECMFIAVTAEDATLITLKHSEDVWSQWSWEEFHETLEPWFERHGGMSYLESKASSIASARNFHEITDILSRLKKRYKI